MSTTALRICVDALSLPRQARAELAHRLLVSLEEDPVKPEVETAWKEVAEQRLEKLKQSATTERDARQVVRDARKKVVRSRQWHTCTAIRTIGRND